MTFFLCKYDNRFFFLGSHGFSVKKVVFKGSQCLYTTSAHILIMSFFQCNKLHCKLFNGLTQTIMNGQALGIGKVNVSLFFPLEHSPYVKILKG